MSQPNVRLFAVGALMLATVLAGCGGPSVMPASAPRSSPLSIAGLIATAQAAFPQVPGGTSFYDCSFDGTLADCPITSRLRARLMSAGITLCNCDRPSPDRAVTAEIQGSKGIGHVALYGGLLKLDLSIVPVGSKLLVDDESMAGRANTSIYAAAVEIPDPSSVGSDNPRQPQAPSIQTIDVPVVAQVMNLDCETAALQMGLAAFGQPSAQAQLFALENPDTRPAVVGAGGIQRWGDPYTNFVGNVNGLETNATGYGVYWPVIAAIAQQHGVPEARGGDGLTADVAYAALQLGHPVEVWVNAGWGLLPTGSWTAWDGRSIPYTLEEHAVTLSGVSAASVRVNDPLHGTQYWIAKTTFERNWADFGNQAVIFN